jgi:hypothetical protein
MRLGLTTQRSARQTDHPLTVLLSAEYYDYRGDSGVLDSYRVQLCIHWRH